MFINYTIHRANGRWQRRTFLNHWRRIYRREVRWTPPYYPALTRALAAAGEEYPAPLDPVLLHIEALPRHRGPDPADPQQLALTPSLFEVPLLATVLLHRRQPGDGVAYLSLFHGANNPESLERLLDHLAEMLPQSGIRRLVGPTGLSPHLERGLLVDSWSQEPPGHTPFSPPYLPEMFASFSLLEKRRLYRLPVSLDPERSSGAAELQPFEPGRLAGDLLPLFAAACAGPHFPPPDAAEAAFILRALGPGAQHGWLAQVDGRPAGFVLLQADLAARLRQSGGGRDWAGRIWLRLAAGRSVDQGRLLFGAVLPDFRRQGIGRQLLQQARATARTEGWQRLIAGPLETISPAAALLLQYGAEAGQRYEVYERVV